MALCVFFTFVLLSLAPASPYSASPTATVTTTSIDWTVMPPTLADRNGAIKKYILYYNRTSTSNVPASMTMEKNITVTRNYSNQDSSVTIKVIGLEEDSTYSFALVTCNSVCTKRRTLTSQKTRSAGKCFSYLYTPSPTHTRHATQNLDWVP